VAVASAGPYANHLHLAPYIKVKDRVPSKELRERLGIGE